MNIKSIGFPDAKPDYDVWVHGWLLQEHVECFRQFINSETKCIVELGSWMGLSSIFFAKECPDAKIYCVDTWDMEIPENEIFRKKIAKTRDNLGERLPASFEQWSVNCWEYKDRMIPIRSHSVDGMKHLYDMEVKPDLIYVDACHGYDCVMDDLMTANELFPDAAIVGDDWQLEAVRCAAVDCAKIINRKLIRFGKKVWYYDKTS